MQNDRILLLGPDAEELSAIARLLKTAGHEAVEAGTGARCLELAKVWLPDIILISGSPPDAYAESICRDIKAHTAAGESLVAVLSYEKGPPEQRAAVLAAGADTVIDRPIPERELLGRLEALLRIKRAEAMLREERNWLASILKYSDDAIIGISLEGRVLTWNPGAERLFGHSEEAAQGEAFQGLLPIESPGRLTDAFEKVTLTAEAVYLASVPVKAESRVQGGHVSITVSPVKDANGDLIGVSLIARDVSVLVRSCETCDRELRTMEGLSGPVQASVTAGAFGLAPVSGNNPRLFSELVEEYTQAIEKAWENKVYRVQHPVSDLLRRIAERLGQAAAGPRDVVQVHITALRNKGEGAPPAKLQAYTEEGRLLLVEVMGYLTSHYRNSLLGMNP
jgi:PAS domain S-box-containing protein